MFAKGLQVAPAGIAAVGPPADVIDFPVPAQLTQAASTQAACGPVDPVTIAAARNKPPQMASSHLVGVGLSCAVCGVSPEGPTVVVGELKGRFAMGPPSDLGAARQLPGFAAMNFAVVGNEGGNN